ncbi:MAG: hypothetical protein ACE367_01030 [Acidimicrobiales bacterium]
MTAIVNELRPGLGWLALTAVGVLLAGTALMLVVLPSSHGFGTSAEGRGQASVDSYRVRCPAPFTRAFDDIGSGAGWFEFTTGEPMIISADSYCTLSARRRMSLALVLGSVGAAAIAAGRRHTAAMPV